MNRDALLAERLLELRRHGFVFDRHETRQQFDNRHLAAEAAEDRRELHADGAAAQDHDRFGHFLQVDGFVAGDDARAIDRDPRNAPRRRSGRDDDFLAREQRLGVAFEHVDAALSRQARRALDPVDLVLLEQELDALGQAADDPVLPLLHLRHVDRDRGLADGNPPFLRVLDDLQRVRVLEQGLGGNAPPQQAGAAERLLLLDDGDLQAELRGADGGHVPAGARADDDDVIFVWHSVISCKGWPAGAPRHHLVAFSDDSGTNAVAPALGPAVGRRGLGARDPAARRVHAIARDRTAVPSTTR